MYEAKKASGGQGHVFAASNILFFSKSHLKNDPEEEKKKTGIIVHSQPYKIRFAQPTEIDFKIEFKKGMNKFDFLQEYVTWEECGIEKGKIVTKKDYDKMKDAAGYPFEHVDKNTGEIRDLVFLPSSTGRWCVKHLGKSLPSESLLFNEEVFTDSVLQDLDKNIIQPGFKYPENVILKDDVLFSQDEEDEE